MLGYEDFGLSLSFHYLYLILALFCIAVYTYFTYKYTVPATGNFQKAVLIILRICALLLLLITLFEPILNLIKKENITPSNFVFIDNSRSITIDDQSNRMENTLQVIEALKAGSDARDLTFYTFGSDVQKVATAGLDTLNFSDGTTDIANIFVALQKGEADISSVILVTDGVFNRGNNPYYSAVKMGVPVFVIGVGDTARKQDMEITKVLYNELIYAETPTTIAATVQNFGLAGKEATVTLKEEGKIVSARRITLSKTGIQNETFEYTPESGGEKKLSVTISGIDMEFTQANNKSIFYLKVLSNKINVLVLASSPSSDLAFIRSSLEGDENLTVNSFIQVSQNNFLENLKYSLIDSADILFLIGFPSDNTPESLWKSVSKQILSEKTPYFLSLSPDISISRLSEIKSELSFIINQTVSGFRQVQPELSPEYIGHPLIEHSSVKIAEAWNNLPPVLQPNHIFSAKPESKVVSAIKLNNKLINSPLILLRNFNGRKSVTILAKEIWRWKLQTATKRSDLFRRFIANSVKWLNTADEQRRVKINSSKRNYSQGERIEFTARVLDETLNPVSDAVVKVRIKSNENTYETDMQILGNGVYGGSFTLNEPDDYSYIGEAIRNGKKIGEDGGTFNVGEIDIEMIDPLMNYNLLNLLARDTGGKFYFNNNYREILMEIDQINENSSREKIITSEIKLWSSEWMLIVVILLFSFEWYIRKRIGLL